MSENTLDPTGETCPNCKDVILTNHNWCPKCGYNKHHISFDDDVKSANPFYWVWYLSLLFLIPSAFCGGCVWASNETMGIIAGVAELISISAGIYLLFRDGVIGSQRG